jgi:hypothetical protein
MILMQNLDRIVNPLHLAPYKIYDNLMMCFNFCVLESTLNATITWYESQLFSQDLLFTFYKLFIMA